MSVLQIEASARLIGQHTSETTSTVCIPDAAFVDREILGEAIKRQCLFCFDEMRAREYDMTQYQIVISASVF